MTRTAGLCDRTGRETTAGYARRSPVEPPEDPGSIPGTSTLAPSVRPSPGDLRGFRGLVVLCVSPAGQPSRSTSATPGHRFVRLVAAERLYRQGRERGTDVDAVQEHRQVATVDLRRDVMRRLHDRGDG